MLAPILLECKLLPRIARSIHKITALTRNRDQVIAQQAADPFDKIWRIKCKFEMVAHQNRAQFSKIMQMTSAGVLELRLAPYIRQRNLHFGLFKLVNREKPHERPAWTSGTPGPVVSWKTRLQLFVLQSDAFLPLLAFVRSLFKLPCSDGPLFER